MTRKARIHGIFGDTNSGKSWYVLNVLIPFYQKHHPHLKQVVITSEDHPDYSKYEFIEAAMLPRWKNPAPGSVKRILVNPADLEQIDNVFMLMNNHLSNAVVYCEDAGGYLPDNMKNSPGILSFIGSAKNQNRETFFQFWAFSEIPNRMSGWFKSMVLFTTRDVVFNPRKNEVTWPSRSVNKLGSAFYKVQGPYEKVLEIKMKAQEMKLPDSDPRMHPKEIVFIN